MIIRKKGDMFFPGSSDFMELAKRKDAATAETERVIVYLFPAINVQEGN